MKHYVSGASSLEFWRYHDELDPAQLRPCPPGKVDAPATAAQSSRLSLGSTPYRGKPLLLVPSASHRCQPGLYDYKVFAGLLPEGAYLMSSATEAQASPEMCFLQMANKLPFEKLIQLGFELCGTYSLRPRTRIGFEPRDSPLTSIAEIDSFLDRIPSYPHKAIAKDALRHILENSNSPAETNVAMRLSLTKRLGGNNIQGLRLNHPIPLNDAAARLFGTDVIRPDFSSDLHKFAGEYDSDLVHLDRARHNRDNIRRNVLQHMGYDVIVFTSDQVASLDTFEILAHDITLKMGQRYRTPTPKQIQAKANLKQLLNDDSFWSTR